MTDESEFQTTGAATLKPRQAKVSDMVTQVPHGRV